MWRQRSQACFWLGGNFVDSFNDSRLLTVESRLLLVLYDTTIDLRQGKWCEIWSDFEHAGMEHGAVVVRPTEVKDDVWLKLCKLVTGTRQGTWGWRGTGTTRCEHGAWWSNVGGMAFGEVLGGCGEKTDGTGSGHCYCMFVCIGVMFDIMSSMYAKFVSMLPMFSRKKEVSVIIWSCLWPNESMSLCIVSICSCMICRWVEGR